MTTHETVHKITDRDELTGTTDLIPITDQDDWVAIHGLNRIDATPEILADYNSKRIYWQNLLATMPDFDLALLSEFVSEEISYRS